MLAALGCGLVGGAAAFFAFLSQWSIEPSYAPAPPAAFSEEAIAPAVMPLATAVEAPPAQARSDEINLVFRAGGATYIKLGSLDELPKHGTLELYDRGEEDDWTTSVIATVETADIPTPYQRWIDGKVIVDGNCQADVTGFAVVARLTGKADYAEGDTNEWSIESVLEHGTPILAAKLDRCAKGTFARDASLPAIEVPTVIDDAPLASQAKDKLLSSWVAAKAQTRWEEAKRSFDWQGSDVTAVDTIVVRHPRTKITWISVHARVEDGCGGPDINIWGLYRVDNGKLVAAQQRDLGDLHSVRRLIDIDGDGEPEFIGAPWVATDTVVSRASGDEVERLALSFYGCPC